MPRKRVLSGLGAAKKRRRKKAAKKPAGKRVSRAAATIKSGKRKGRLRKGCRYLKGDGAMCTSTGRKKTRRKGRKKSSKKKRAKKVHAYSLKSTLVFKKGKGGKKILKKGCSRRTKGKYKGKIVCRRKMSRAKKR